MIAKVIDLSGSQVGQLDLPPVFEEEYRPDLIKKAVLASQANRLQPYGPHFYAGMNTSARSWGPGHGVSRVPRLINGRKAAGIPMAMGGRASHPPVPQKVLSEKINEKERKKAIRSAIAATTNLSLVKARGHKFTGELPFVVQAEFEGISKTSDVRKFLISAGLWSDVERAKDGLKVRAGKGKLRGRRFRRPKSLLIVVSKDQGIGKAVRNLPGVDFITVNGLNAEMLAPGTHAGRLVLWTEPSIGLLGDKK